MLKKNIGRKIITTFADGFSRSKNYGKEDFSDDAFDDYDGFIRHGAK